MANTINNILQAFATEFDRRFDKLLTDGAEDSHSPLFEAMRYSALAPGKRIRPFLVVRCCELVGGDRGHAWSVAAAVECIHAFSLIHDDLPAMDDDDLRRGRPTCHRKFGEAIAILAGDALSALAFTLLSELKAEASLRVQLVQELALATGWSGMIGGQAADVVGQDQASSRELLSYIHARKTARLFEAACRMGAMCGAGNDKFVNQLAQFGHMLGQSFQIADDLLDVTSTQHELGKAVGKDGLAGKQTYPACFGLEESQKAAQRARDAALACLDSMGDEADDLRQLARFVVDRKH